MKSCQTYVLKPVQTMAGVEMARACVLQGGLAVRAV